GWRRVDRQAEARESARQHASRALHVYPDADGTVILRGRLTPDVGALLMQALAAARETLYQQDRAKEPEGDPPTMVQQQADALALLAETALHHGIDPGAPGERYQVVIHVDAEILADADQPGQSVLEDGLRVPAGTSQRLARAASRAVMRHHPAGRQASARGSSSSGGARRSGPDSASAARCGGARPACADRDPEVAGRAPGRGLGDRRLAPVGAGIPVPAYRATV